MLKKIMCIICTLIILISISIVPVSAEEATGTTTTTVNEWTVQHWSAVLGENFDTTKYTDEVLSNIYSMADDEHKIAVIIPSSNTASFISTNNDISYTRKINDTTTFIGFQSDVSFGYNYLTTTTLDLIQGAALYNSLYKYYYYASKSLSGLSDNYYIVDDINEYNKIMAFDFDYKDHIFYCENPIESFRNYVKGIDISLNKVVAPDGFNKSGIKYSYSFDNPYNNYGIKPYESEMENYVTAGLFSDLDIYYNSEFIKGSQHEHAEDITFYVDTGQVEGSYFDEFYSYDGVKIPDNDLNAFMNTHFKAIHFEKDNYTVLDFFAPAGNYTSFSDFITLHKINDKYYLAFTLKSEYTLVGSTFNGIRITHSCRYINTVTGELGGSGNGLGSDESEADDSLSRPPTKEELKDYGFNYGYPNTQGSYPYKLTIYRNGIEYFQMYFNKMPSVSSTYYSDKCIDYGVNVMNTKVYMYFKEQNMSKSFDFTNNNDDIYNSDMVQPGGIYDNFMFKPIDEATGHLLNSLLNVNVSEFNNTYTLHFWTNYSGTFENMSGFYCKFNWDLANSGHFQKNNSDDEYDYTQDYMPEDSFTDNNGNIHGGAVEPPTEDPVYNGFNNQDFSFDENSLWDYADSFLNFCARAFKVLPAFIWQLIACSMVVVIILRIVGR